MQNRSEGFGIMGALPTDRWQFMKDSLEPGVRENPENSRGFSRSRIILVGARRDARRLLQQMRKDPGRGMMIVGFVDAGHQQTSSPKFRGRHLAVHPQADPVPVVGGLDRLHELVDRTRATDVVVAMTRETKRPPLTRLSHFTKSDVKVHWVPIDGQRLDLASLPLRRAAEDLKARVGSQDWFRAASPWLSSISWARMAKRLSDILLSGLGLLLLSPLFAVISVAILVTSGRPIFYSQERVGQGGRRFRIIKFRSMNTDAESQTGPIWASNHDSRCTRIGEWLRHTNIDELPQLFNVLKGDMSLVGPRPERPMFVEQFRHAMPDYDLRHAVPAGMTGWAQVHGWRGRTSLRKRIQYDLDYMHRWSFWLDLQIMLMTIQHVAWGKISWNLSRPPKQYGEQSS
jgi:exopolysaccharide biosynthesis polyprenyl glycosylphosphotransferase